MDVRCKMADVRRKISLSFLLLLLTISAAAQDVTIQRGCRVGTPRPEGMALRRGAPTGQKKQTGGDFYYGERHQLTVMVEFNDRAFKGDEEATLAQWNLIFNAKDLKEPPFKGSVHDYFYAQSYMVSSTWILTCTTSRSAVMLRNMPARMLTMRTRSIWCRTSWRC